MSETAVSRQPENTRENGRQRGQAEGHEFAIRTLAETRQQTKNLLTALNATDRVARNQMFLPDGYRPDRNIHAQAHAGVLTYLEELTKPTYLKQANAGEFISETYTHASIPADLADSEVITVDVSDPRDDVDPASADLEMVEWPITLENLGWWSMRFVTVKKEIDSPYWTKDSEETRRKVVLPPRVIQSSFHRLDDLAAEMGVLIQVQQESPHAGT